MWEYKVVVKTKWAPNLAERIESELNELGYQGWELISALPTAMGFGATASVMLIFKRQYSPKVQEL